MKLKSFCAKAAMDVRWGVILLGLDLKVDGSMKKWL